VKIRAAGSSALAGGDTVDMQLARDFLARVKKELGDLQNEKHVARHILSAAEAAKRDLAKRGKTEMSFQVGRGKTRVRHTYTAEDFERWLEPLKSEAERLSQRLLSEAGLLKGDVDLLVLAGGMVGIESLRTHLQGQLGREVAGGIDPEEATVLGAHVRARLLDHKQSDILVLDSLPSRLGLERADKSVGAILDRGVSLPAGNREVYTTYLERQTEVAIQLYGDTGSGWSPWAQVEVSKIPSMKAGIPALEVDFMVDEDGVLEVKANETTRSKPLTLEVRPVRGLSSSMVKATLAALPEAKEADFKTQLRDELSSRGRFILDTLRELDRRSSGIMTRDEKQLITKKSKEFEEVMEGADPMEMRACTQELEEAARPLMQRDVDASLLSLLR